MKKKTSVVVRRDDGYTIPTRIKAFTGRGEVEIHGELQFDRRPTGPEHVALFHDAIDGKSESQILDISCEMIAEQVVKWDAVDVEGKPVPLTKDGIRMLHWKLITRMRDIVCLASEGGDALEVTDSVPDSSIALMASLRKNS